MKTGHPIVDAIGGMKFIGHTIPHAWWKAPALLSDASKRDPRVNTVAVILLADICYFFRPMYDIDPATNQIANVRRQFAGNDLQYDYKAKAAHFGLTKRQVQDAVGFLEKRGLIKRRVVRPSNDVFVAPIVEMIRAISNLEKDGIRLPKKREPAPGKTEGGSRSTVRRPAKKRERTSKSTREEFFNTQQQGDEDKNVPDVGVSLTTSDSVELSDQEFHEWSERLKMLRVTPGRIDYLLDKYAANVIIAVPWWEANREYLESREKPGGAVASSITKPSSYPQIYATPEPQNAEKRPAPKRISKAEQREKFAAAYETIWESLAASLRGSLEREGKDKFEYIEKIHPNDLADAIRKAGRGGGG